MLCFSLPDLIAHKILSHTVTASTDPLDGLNKPVSDELTHYYVQQFNRTCVDQMGNRLLSPHRPYIIQIARFDPSKGIDDVLEAYRLLRERMDTRFALRAVPQLVICGHGSVDDPDATVVYNHVMDVLASDEFVTVRNDVCVVRLPPSDQLLNALMRGASVALQLSHREGTQMGCR